MCNFDRIEIPSYNRSKKIHLCCYQWIQPSGRGCNCVRLYDGVDIKIHFFNTILTQWNDSKENGFENGTFSRNSLRKHVEENLEATTKKRLNIEVKNMSRKDFLVTLITQICKKYEQKKSTSICQLKQLTYAYLLLTNI